MEYLDSQNSDHQVREGLTHVMEDLLAENPPAVGNSGRTREQVLHDQTIINRFGSRRLAQAALDRTCQRPDV